MTNRPIKKSDKNKSWMRPRRDKYIKIQPEYHLIVTEGTKTEPYYFYKIKEIINHKYRGKIQLDIFGEGESTVSLFEKARNRVKKSAIVYRHVWIVFDTDDFPPENINKTVDLCINEGNTETEYHAIWSNQCIELWYLLHFDYVNTDIHRSEYYHKLTKCLEKIDKGEYTKWRNDMFDVLWPYIETAISNARRLEKININQTPSNSAPGTMMHVMIEKFKEYLSIE